MVPEEVDLAVLADRERHPSLHGATFLHDRFVVIVATDDPWQERGHVAVCDLGTRRLLMRERGAGTRAFVDAALRAAGVHPAELLEIASLEALKRITQAHGPRPVSAWPWRHHVLPWSARPPRDTLCVLELNVQGNRLAYCLLRHVISG
jgi:LysR substrate binding domain